MEKFDDSEWNEVSKAIFFESGKFISPKSCMERWKNHLSDKIKKSKWTEEEDEKLLSLTKEMGNKWAAIAKVLNNGKNDHMVKNRFLSIQNRKKKELRKVESTNLNNEEEEDEKEKEEQKMLELVGMSEDENEYMESFSEFGMKEELYSLGIDLSKDDFFLQSHSMED